MSKPCSVICLKIMDTERNSVIIFFIVLGCVVTVSSLNCFQCSSSTDKDCDILTIANTTSPYYLPCPSNTTFCRKISQTIIAHEKQVITRKCGWLTNYPGETKCIKYDTQFKMDKTCQCYIDGCNSAPSTTQKWTILLLFVSLINMFRNKCF